LCFQGASLLPLLKVYGLGAFSTDIKAQLRTAEVTHYNLRVEFEVKDELNPKKNRRAES
jgi:hypothetical protein